MFKIMWLRLWRDKGALVLAFILPGFIFAIFAAIFSNASGGSLDLRVSMALTSDAPASIMLAKNIEDKATFTLSTNDDWNAESVRERVRLGQDDVGFIIAGDISQPGLKSIAIIKDPSREVAATVLMGQLRQIMAEGAQVNSPEVFTEVSAMPETQNDNVTDQSVTYYIGATAILFLLFSAMQGAAISLDERKNGISDRLLVGPSGAFAMLTGKFLFLTLIGTIQAAIIVAVGHVAFGVSVMEHLPSLALACMGSAALASAIAVLVASLSGSSAQMNTVSTFIVLLFSAIGGSMVPRFMMPDWLQSLGRFTPNHWSIEAFYGILARGQTAFDLLHVWGILFGLAAVILLLAALISHRMMRV
ncbi:ABC transporter permease [Hellea balneolensis]|uniref:ABC transporter permease n=1 Tax=Hellea balneolensis TaxID=287478 RepID=UPI00138AE4A1|nr:ABC transporter permease [Hellea balneolensis]